MAHVKEQRMDFNELTDEELNSHRQAITNEIGRRTSLSAIPHQVTQLAQAYIAAGGDPADLTAALDQEQPEP